MREIIPVLKHLEDVSKGVSANSDCVFQTDGTLNTVNWDTFCGLNWISDSDQIEPPIPVNCPHWGTYNRLHDSVDSRVNSWSGSFHDKMIDLAS